MITLIILGGVREGVGLALFVPIFWLRAPQAAATPPARTIHYRSFMHNLLTKPESDYAFQFDDTKHKR